jgi:hypothetical protein
MVSSVDQSDAEFVCARWKPLAPNGNIQTASTRGERSVTGLWTGLWGESGQCAETRIKGVMAILSLGAIKGECGRPWHMVGTLRT